MTIRKFFVAFVLQALFLTALKVLFFRYFDTADVYWIFLYWAAIIIITVGLVRRLGVINFFEAIFVAIFWIVCDLFIDLIITAPLTTLSIFITAWFWGGYVVLAAFVFAMHKKRHIHIRKEQRAHHHGHH